MKKHLEIVNKYLADARTHQQHRHFDGQFSHPGAFGGANMFRQGYGMAPYANADGGMSPSAPTSQPYVVNVTSTSGAAVSNFTIFAANERTGNYSNWVNGNYVDGSITISSGIPDVTYQMLCEQLKQQPVLIAQLYMQSATTNQLLQTISVVEKDANGNSQTRPIIPVISPTQFQSTVNLIKQAFPINGNTKLVIASILANTTLTLQFYPSNKVNTSAVLDGANADRTYSDPQIVPAQTLVIQ